MNGIASNITARESAEAIADLVREALADLPAESHGRFWSVLWDALAPPVASSSDSDKMSDTQARHFGNCIVPERFRRYAGCRVDGVPLWYWERITEEDEFVRQLKRYLRSERIQGEQ